MSFGFSLQHADPLTDSPTLSTPHNSVLLENQVLSLLVKKFPFPLTTLRTGDTDLRFYITTVQDG